MIIRRYTRWGTSWYGGSVRVCDYEAKYIDKMNIRANVINTAKQNFDTLRVRCSQYLKTELSE